MTADLGPTIGDAFALADRSDEDGCLRALLDVWRRERLPRIANLIDGVSAWVTEATARRPLTREEAKSTKAKTDLWTTLAEARDPSDLDRLLLVPWPRTRQTRMDRLALLTAWPDDPRMAMALARLLVFPLAWNRVEDADFYRAALAKISSIGDVRVLAHLSKRTPLLHPLWYRHGVYVGHEADIVSALTDEERRLSSGSRLRMTTDAEEHAFGALETLVQNRKTRAQTKKRTEAQGEETHLAAIEASPDDDAPRQVFADWLSERGDPRGELITIQLARARATRDRNSSPLGVGFTTAMARRESKLLADHGAALAGSLDPWLLREPREYDRGRIVRGALVPSIRLDPLIEAFRDPSWSSVQALSMGEAPYEFTRALHNSSLRSLRAVHDLTSSQMVQLCRDRVALLASSGGSIEDGGFFPPIEEASFTVLSDAAWFQTNADIVGRDPHLRRLGIAFVPPNAQLGWLLDSGSGGLLTRLEKLTIVGGPEDLGVWSQRLNERLAKALSSRSLPLPARARDRLASFTLVVREKTPPVLTGARGRINLRLQMARPHFIRPEGLTFTLSPLKDGGRLLHSLTIERFAENAPQKTPSTLLTALRSMWSKDVPLTEIEIRPSSTLRLDTQDRAAIEEVIARFPKVSRVRLPWKG